MLVDAIGNLDVCQVCDKAFEINLAYVQDRSLETAAGQDCQETIRRSHKREMMQDSVDDVVKVYGHALAVSRVVRLLTTKVFDATELREYRLGLREWENGGDAAFAEGYVTEIDFLLGDLDK